MPAWLASFNAWRRLKLKQGSQAPSLIKAGQRIPHRNK
jgi:hypothetical protein